MDTTKPFIGLVLAMPPRYSETFLASKIQGLRDDGFDVAVFVGAGTAEPGIYPGLGIKIGKSVV